jgi:hypothetical protein
LPSIAWFGRLAYPMPAPVTVRVLLGRKRHSRPAKNRVAAVGETWVASKPGGLNVRNSDDLETPAARSLFAGQIGKPTYWLDLGKADGVGEETGECTLQPDGIMAQASWERLAEITSGRTKSQQGAGGNLQRPPEIREQHEVWWRGLVWRMSSYE